MVFSNGAHKLNYSTRFDLHECSRTERDGGGHFEFSAKVVASFRSFVGDYRTIRGNYLARAVHRRLPRIEKKYTAVGAAKQLVWNIMDVNGSPTTQFQN